MSAQRICERQRVFVFLQHFPHDFVQIFNPWQVCIQVFGNFSFPLICPANDEHGHKISPPIAAAASVINSDSEMQNPQVSGYTAEHAAAYVLMHSIPHNEHDNEHFRRSKRVRHAVYPQSEKHRKQNKFSN